MRLKFQISHAMRFILIFVTFLSLFPINLRAQEKVSLSGFIRDKRHNPISQALIAVEGTTTGTYSDNNGYYNIQLLPGIYKFTISAYSYKLQQDTLNVFKPQQQDFILDEQLIQLSTLEVQGKSLSQQTKEGSYTVNSIDIKNKLNNVGNLNDIIGKSSGVRIRENGGTGSTFNLSLDGLSGHSIRYFIDGKPLSSLGNSTSITNIPINIVDRIDIYKGVVPTDLGSDALGGAVNIITKRNIKNYIDLSWGFGSFNTYNANFTAQYSNSKTGLFIQPTLGIDYSKNNYTMKGVEIWNSTTSEFDHINVKRFHDQYSNAFSMLTAGIRQRPWADILSVSGNYSLSNKQLQTGDVQSVVYGKAEKENMSYGLSVQYKKQDFFIKRFSSNITLSYANDRMTVVDTTFRKYKWDGSYIQSSRNEITGRARSIRHISRPTITSKVNFNYSINTQNSINFNYLLDKVNNNRYDDLDMDFEPSEDALTKNIIGVSYNQQLYHNSLINSFFVKDYLSHMQIGQKDLSWITGSDEVKSSTYTNYWGYGLSSRFRYTDALAMKVSFEHCVRLPLANEYLGNGVTIYPNFSLKPESSNNINLGFFGTLNSQSKHTFYYESGLFYRKVQDYIRLVITEAEGTSQYDNVNNVTVKGIEGELKYNYNNVFQAVANMSYLDEKNKTKYQANGKPEITYNNRMPNQPWLFGNLELNFVRKNIVGQKNNQLKMTYDFQYVHWFYLTWEGYGSLSSKSIIPSQYISNIALTYSFKKEKYNISIECNNLFDQTVYDNYMMQKPGRAFFCKWRLFIN